MIEELFKRDFRGRTRKVIERAFYLVTDFLGSYGYSREGGLRII